MSSKRLALYALLISIFSACSSARIDQSSESIPDGARRIMEAYPDCVVGYERDSLIFWDGTRLIFDDKISRTVDQIHLEQDVEDIFFQEYDTTLYPPTYGYDPGRYRCAEFFDKIYGSTYDEVCNNLVWVDWCPSFGGKPLLFSRMAGAAEALKLALVGGLTFTVTTWLFSTIQERLSSGPAAKASAFFSAVSLYMAAQCFMGIGL